MSPPSCWTVVSTTSMPTPRPDVSVTLAAVEKPAPKMKRWMSCGFRRGASAAVIEAARNRLVEDGGGVQPAAVVRHADLDLAAVLHRGHRHRRLRRLAGAGALLGRPDAVIDGVPHHVHQWIDQQLDRALVDLHVTALQHEPDILALLLGQRAHDSRKAGQDGVDRHDAELERRRLQPPQVGFDDAGELCGRALSLPAGILVRRGRRFRELGGDDSDLADPGHEVGRSRRCARAGPSSCARRRRPAHGPARRGRPPRPGRRRPPPRPARRRAAALRRHGAATSRTGAGGRATAAPRAPLRADAATGSGNRTSSRRWSAPCGC